MDDTDNEEKAQDSKESQCTINRSKIKSVNSQSLPLQRRPSGMSLKSFRRERNRIAAQKSREKKSNLIANLQERNSILEKQITEVKQNISKCVCEFKEWFLTLE